MGIIEYSIAISCSKSKHNERSLFHRLESGILNDQKIQEP